MKLTHFLIMFLLLFLSCSQEGYAPGCNPCRIFVSDTTSQGNFQTISAADSICNNDANRPLNGYYKALIVSENGSRIACTTHRCLGNGNSEHVDWVLYPSTVYNRTEDGATIGTTNSYAIFELPLTNPFSATAGNAWTGFDLPDTEWMATSQDSCDSWTSATDSSPPGAGTSYLNDGSNFNMAFAFGNNCDEQNKFICVEQ